MRSRVALVAYKIGKEAWDKVNDMRIEKQDYEMQHPEAITLEMFDSNGRKTYNIKERAYEQRVFPSEVYRDYLECLYEYNYSLAHAWAYGHEISLWDSRKCKKIKPVIDFDESHLVLKTNKVRTLIKRYSNK